MRAAETSPAQPNIILVMPDDVGYGDYASLGNPVTHTPAVEAFKMDPLKELYWKQFGGGPDARMLKRMTPRQ